MLAQARFRSVAAVEPNGEMRDAGIRDSEGLEIDWRPGRAEDTGLDDASADLVTMASSFHWAGFEDATAEFCRVLRPGGWFVALWNPRLVEANPLLAEIEAELSRIKPDLKRVSSGRSAFTDGLAERLWSHPGFEDVVVLEGRHVVRQSPAHHVGAWRTVNDVRVQLGEEGFATFLDFVERRLAAVETVETTYLTRAWAARRAA
jgi:SAM-dependent methyltransferase